MITLALAGLRHRLAAFVATFLAVLVGSALIIACGGLFETAIRLSAPPERLAGAPLLVTGPAGFSLPDQESETVPYAERSTVDLAKVAEIRAVPGVADVVPDLSFPAVLLGGGDTTLAGHDWVSARLTPYTLRAGVAPRAGQVVLDTATAQRAGAAPGKRVELIVAGASRTFVVSGVADGPVTAMFFATADARRFTPHPDQADFIGVIPAEGVSVDELAARMPAGVIVLTGDERGAAEFTGIGGSRLPLILLAAIFGGMVAVVMSLVVWATISLSVRQRQRELALLRATGATPDQARALVVTETMVIAVLACLGGLVLGRLVGDSIFDESVSRGVVPTALEFRAGPIPFAGGALLGLGVPWLTARFAGGAAARTRPVQALVEASIPTPRVHPVRRLLALVFVAATGALAITTVFLDADTASAIGGPAVLTGAIAVALFGPELIVVLVDRAAPFVRRFAPRGGALAVINTRARAVQFAAVLTPVTLAVAVALGNVYTQTTMDDEALAVAVDQFRTDAVLTSSAGGIAPSVLTGVRGADGVTAASALVPRRGDLAVHGAADDTRRRRADPDRTAMGVPRGGRDCLRDRVAGDVVDRTDGHAPQTGRGDRQSLRHAQRGQEMTEHDGEVWDPYRPPRRTRRADRRACPGHRVGPPNPRGDGRRNPGRLPDPIQLGSGRPARTRLRTPDHRRRMGPTARTRRTHHRLTTPHDRHGPHTRVPATPTPRTTPSYRIQPPCQRPHPRTAQPARPGPSRRRRSRPHSPPSRHPRDRRRRLPRRPSRH